MVYRSSDLVRSVNSLLKGIGQIMLQDNSWTGLAFLTGICWVSIPMGIAVLVAVVVGTYTAKLLRYNDNEINSGIYGFSAALVGVALIYFFQSTVAVWIALIAGSALATILQHLFIKKNIPAYTFPFILVTWLVMVVAAYFPDLLPAQVASTGVWPENYLTLLAHGFGQVIFQDNVWAGVLFITGVLINRPVAAIYGIIGVIFSSMLAYTLKESVSDIYSGIFGYNAVLCAIVFAGKKAENFLMALVAVGLSVVIMAGMKHLNLPALTFPFVLATWLTLIAKMIQRTIRSKSPVH